MTEVVTVALASLVALVGAGAASIITAGPAGATTLTPLTAASFLANSVAVNEWSLPVGTTANAACLTAGPTTSTTSVPDCSPTTDTGGSGALQLTTNTNNQVGSVFNTTSLPTGQGLDVEFDAYQFDPSATQGADGISFSLAAANPADPVPPAATGQLGGALGYSTNQSGAGLPDGYLGIGLDVFGNYLNSAYGGASCPADGALTNQKYPQSVTVRGPGDGTSGYCILATTADSAAPSTTNNLPGGTGALDSTGQTTHDATDDVPVEVALNPGTTSTTTGSGLVVPAGKFAVRFTPVGGTSQTILGALPSLIGNTIGIPSSWYNPTTGLPYQLSFGWTASTGAKNEYHEVNTLTSQTVTGTLPVYSLAETDNNGGIHNLSASGQSVTLTPALESAAQSGGNESDPPTVTDTFPTGVVPGTPTGTSWNCAGSSGQTVSCLYVGAEPVAAGSTYPAITVPLTVTGSSTPGAGTDKPEVSSIDGLASQAVNSFTVVWPPSAPTASSATALDNSARVTWTAPATTNAGAVTGYVVTPYVGSTALAPSTFTSTSTTQTMTGLTSGTSYTFTVAAVNSAGTGTTSAATAAVTPNVNPSLTTTSLPGTEVGLAYNQTVHATGGTSPITWAVTSGSLPAGLTLNASTGALTGSPTASGTSTFTVTATDAAGVTASHPYTVGVNTAPAISTSSITAGDSGSTYSQTVAATGGTGTYTWSLTSGNLPQGLSLDPSTGAISGTLAPTATSQTFTVLVTDGDGDTSSHTFTLTVNGAPSVGTTSVPSSEVGAPYSQILTGSGGTSPYSWQVASGSLPPGLTLSAGGTISGTPTTTGSSSFTVRLTDASGKTATDAYTISIGAAPSITTAAVPAGDAGSTYTTTLVATGGTGPYTWSLSSGSLPAGVTLNPTTGVLSGSPSAAGSSTFTVQVSDGDNATASHTYTVDVNAAPAVTTSSLVGADSGTSYSQMLHASGGTAPFTWTAAPGTLPPDLTLSPAGVLSGTPTTTGSTTFTLTATDSTGTVATKSVTLVVSAPPSVATPTLASGDSGAGYSQAVTTAGGSGPYTYTVSVGTLPAGLTLDPSTGVISGSPTTIGSSTFTVTSTDADGVAASRSFTVVIASPLVEPPGPLTGADAATSYVQAIGVAGGTGPFTFVVTGGSLPAGLTLDATTGLITGTPTGSGGSFTVTVTDATGATAVQTYWLPVNPTPTLSSTTLGTADSGTPVDVAVPVTGGSGPYVYTVTSGALPAGLTLDTSTGTITGTPTTTGTGTFTIQVTDADNVSASRSYSLPVEAPPTITTATLPPVDSGVSYLQTVNGSGGSGTYTYSVTGGALPAGLTLDPSTGTISGTPSGSGPSTFTVTLRDSNGGTAATTYTIDVSTVPAFTSSTITGADVGAAYDGAPAVSGGSGPFDFTLSSGSLPSGLTLDPSTGTITGTPLTIGSSSFTVTVTDADGRSAQQTYVLTVGPPPSIVTSALPTASAGATYVQTLATVNGAGPFDWAVSSSSLPAGLWLDPTTGAITGTPAAAGTSDFTVTVTDADHQSASRSFTLVTMSRPAISTPSVPEGSVGVAYAAPLAATGGMAPYTWSAGGSSLPAGLSIGATTGLVSGTPMLGGTYSVTVQLTDARGQASSHTYSVVILPAPLNSRPIARTPDGGGYWLVGDNGVVLAFGDAHLYGSLAGQHLNQPLVAMAATPDGKGYWLAGTDGGVFCFGDAGFYGSAGALRLNKPILGMAATPDGKGYWLVASDGGVFSYGDAHFYGSTGNIRLNKPVVGMAADSNGRGYWLVASDGGIFSFGSAPFYGSTGAMHLNKPVDGMAATPDNGGYWLVASDGGIFSFGDARFHGSLGNIHLVQPITGMAATPDGGGYWLAAADGGVFAGGNARFYGSGAGRILQVVP